MYVLKVSVIYFTVTVIVIGKTTKIVSYDSVDYYFVSCECGLKMYLMKMWTNNKVSYNSVD